MAHWFPVVFTLYCLMYLAGGFYGVIVQHQPMAGLVILMAIFQWWYFIGRHTGRK